MYKCGCVSESRSDDWFRSESRDVKHCDVWLKILEKYNRECREVEIYNAPIEKRLGEIYSYINTIKDKHTKRLERKLSEKDEYLIPIKYLYELRKSKHNISTLSDHEMEIFAVQKIRSRYYCCKNRTDYYLKWLGKKNIRDEQIARKKERFITNKGWTKKDITVKYKPWKDMHILQHV